MSTVLFIIPCLTNRLPKAWSSNIASVALDGAYEKFLRLSTSHKTHHHTIKDALDTYLHLPENVAWARCGLDASGIRVRSNNWFKLTLLTKVGPTALRGHMVQKMAEDFAHHFSFAEDSIVTTGGDWFISLKQHNQVTSTPLWKITPHDRDSGSYGLSGEDAAYWQEQFINAQQWLKTYSYNRLRMRQKYDPIVDFWPWGNGGEHTFSRQDIEYSAIFSDSAIVRGVGSAAGLSYFPLRNSTADFSQMVHNHPNICVVDDRLVSKVSDNDILGWLDARTQIANMLLAPTLAAVDQGLIQNVIIDTVDGERFIYNKKFKFVLIRPKFTYRYLAE
ncbi:hypothetical protein [Wohlfahrtiimonas sp. G9077]|uniref:hypothetical protein n=1 Tax=Wohlfahrtiimonas sp. G9077 TaxID=1980118 RepID=UPI000B97D40E|nr:hypothetical protein [Wohlfahrtiimonas sp. G9077]OYQ75727.1 hypothetical protein B9T20_03220 [Wohlfahrtiimonas sp. G9077]